MWLKSVQTRIHEKYLKLISSLNQNSERVKWRNCLYNMNFICKKCLFDQGKMFTSRMIFFLTKARLTNLPFRFGENWIRLLKFWIFLSQLSPSSLMSFFDSGIYCPPKHINWNTFQNSIWGVPLLQVNVSKEILLIIFSELSWNQND